MDQVLPSQVYRTKERVAKVDAESNTIETEGGNKFSYDHVIVASGFKYDWNKIKGSKELLDDPNSNVGTIYSADYVEKVARLGKNFKGGKAIFHEPALRIKCAGAPQKILYLWTDKWQSRNIPVDV